MRLKRLYDLTGKHPVVSGIKVLHSGPIQHLSPNIVEIGTEEGWLTLEGGKITIHGEDGPVVYKILRPPGRYEDGVIHYYDCEKAKGGR